MPYHVAVPLLSCLTGILFVVGNAVAPGTFWFTGSYFVALGTHAAIGALAGWIIGRSTP